MKGERMAKRSSFGSIMRKRLSDITNTAHSLPKILNQDEKPPQISSSAEDYVNKLVKENMTLLKVIEERNKIIELSGNELRNLRISYQKLQLQNWNLAQSNSQILAEVNVGRDRLKTLQHELVCKDALLKAKNSELEGKMQKTNQNTGFQEGDKAAGEGLNRAGDDVKQNNCNRRRNARSQSMGPSTTRRQAVEKEKVENKRRCLRRQSARFRSQEREPTDNLFEIDNVKCAVSQPLDDNSMNKDISGLSNTKEQNCEQGNEGSQRYSMGRPLRRAVERVQSYKEVPLNVKMRRQD